MRSTGPDRYDGCGHYLKAREIGQRRWIFLAAALIAIAVVGYELASGSPRTAAMFSAGLVAGMAVTSSFFGWTSAVRTDEALQDMRGILGDAVKAGRKLDHTDTEFALANGIAHGLRYFHFVMDPQHPRSEFQRICNEAEKDQPATQDQSSP